MLTVMTLSGSQPTYEELKQHRIGVVKSLRISSQPTYEELKPEEIRVTFLELLVLSLPMRN